MSSVKKEKQSANTRTRRHSRDIKKSKKHKDKDTDTDSVTSSNASSDASIQKRCPLRFMLAGMMEAEATDDKSHQGCPLRRVELWHTIPLCLLAVVNILLIIIALLGLAAYRIVTGVQGLIFKSLKTKPPLNFSEESPIEVATRRWGHRIKAE